MKNTRATILFTAVLPLLVMANNALAQEVEVETYAPPEPVNRINPNYPGDALSENEEGDVEVNMMIDTNGKPFEITITNATGPKSFRKATVAAIEQWTFTPASANGKPVIGSVRNLMRFVVEGNNSGASQKFIFFYRDLLDAVNSKSREEAEAKLVKLEQLSKNHYENAFTNLAHYTFELKYGTTEKQRHYLEAALSFSRVVKDAVFLPRESAKAARRQLMTLEVKSKLFKEALATYSLFGTSGDKEAEQIFKPVVDKILALENNDQSYEVGFQLDDSGLGGFYLLKHKFFVSRVEGKVDEFKVRCEKKYVGFAAEVDFSYDIPKEWGACSLEMIGSPNTIVRVTQH